MQWQTIHKSNRIADKHGFLEPTERTMGPSNPDGSAARRAHVWAPKWGGFSGTPPDIQSMATWVCSIYSETILNRNTVETDGKTGDHAGDCLSCSTVSARRFGALSKDLGTKQLIRINLGSFEMFVWMKIFSIGGQETTLFGFHTLRTEACRSVCVGPCIGQV